jgi:hypothetical protein
MEEDWASSYVRLQWNPRTGDKILKGRIKESGVRIRELEIQALLHMFVKPSVNSVTSVRVFLLPENREPA